MSRPFLASSAGIGFIIAYVVAAITLPDLWPGLHWSLQAIYWAIAGIVWVFPIRWLMLWSVHKR